MNLIEGGLHTDHAMAAPEIKQVNKDDSKNFLKQTHKPIGSRQLDNINDFHGVDLLHLSCR
jgi:hypothetical protein